MPPLRDAWETGYRTRGRIWGGSPGCIPPLPASGRVLELGCGDGKTLSFLVSSGAGTPPGAIDSTSSAGILTKAPDAGLPGQQGEGSRVTPVPDTGLSQPATESIPTEIIGADFSLEALRLCRGRTEFGPVRFVAADARCLPFRNGTFSLVLMLHLAGHATAPGREVMAREAMRVLMPGGSLYFAGFARGDMRAGKGVEVEPYTFRRNDGTITHYFTEDEVKGLFSLLNPVRVETRNWELRVRGVSHPRAEINAWFTKEWE
jgi:SAM-dependent methyltransferase